MLMSLRAFTWGSNRKKLLNLTILGLWSEPRPDKARAPAACWSSTLQIRPIKMQKKNAKKKKKTCGCNTLCYILLLFISSSSFGCSFPFLMYLQGRRTHTFSAAPLTILTHAHTAVCFLCQDGNLQNNSRDLSATSSSAAKVEALRCLGSVCSMSVSAPGAG